MERSTRRFNGHAGSNPNGIDAAAIRALVTMETSAREDENVVERVIAAVKAGVSIDENSDVLWDVYGDGDGVLSKYSKV